MARNPIPKAWLSPVKMRGIVLHWTAGQHKASEFDRAHYHILIEHDGKLIRGIPPISANALPISPNYAAHTRNLNGGFIGVSLCCMGGINVRENPFVPGPWPMTREQWDKMVCVIAQLCSAYNIPISPKTVLSHAEVQGTLGIAQAGKWDFTRLAFDLNIKGARAIGDRFRAEAEQIIAKVPVSVMSEDADEKGHEYTADSVENPSVMEETIQTNRQETEPMSPFRNVLNWINGAGVVVGGVVASIWTYVMQLDWRVLVALLFTVGFFSTVIFIVTWLYPRPIIVEKQ